MIAIYDKTLAAACNAEIFSYGQRLLWGKKLEDILDVACRVSGKEMRIITTAVHKSKITGETIILSRELVCKKGVPYATEEQY